MNFVAHFGWAHCLGAETNLVLATVILDLRDDSCCDPIAGICLHSGLAERGVVGEEATFKYEGLSALKGFGFIWTQRVEALLLSK